MLKMINEKLNEKGIALVMVLILSAIALAVMAALVYMLTSGTQISGMQKRYRTALEAGVGGADVTFQLITARGDPGIPLDNFTITASVDCLTKKLNSSTAAWGGCSHSLVLDPTDPATYDMSFELGTPGFPTYKIHSKIVDTVEGNSGGDFGLTKTAVVETGQGEITPMSIPYLYTIEIDSQNVANPNERAKYSILYQF